MDQDLLNIRFGDDDKFEELLEHFQSNSSLTVDALLKFLVSYHEIHTTFINAINASPSQRSSERNHFLARLGKASSETSLNVLMGSYLSQLETAFEKFDIAESMANVNLYFPTLTEFFRGKGLCYFRLW
jgi:hypothetical protein